MLGQLDYGLRPTLAGCERVRAFVFVCAPPKQYKPCGKLMIVREEEMGRIGVSLRPHFTISNANAFRARSVQLTKIEAPTEWTERSDHKPWDRLIEFSVFCKYYYDCISFHPHDLLWRRRRRRMCVNQARSFPFAPRSRRWWLAGMRKFVVIIQKNFSV